MRMARLRHVPVVRSGILVGVLSYRDLADAFLDAGRTGPADSFLRATPVSGLVRGAPVTIAPGESLAEAVDRMLALRLGCLPVAVPTDGGPRLVGLLTESDLLRAAYR